MKYQVGDKVRVVFMGDEDDIDDRLNIHPREYAKFNKQEVVIVDRDVKDEDQPYKVYIEGSDPKTVWVAECDLKPVSNDTITPVEAPDVKLTLRPLGFIIDKLRIEVEYDGEKAKYITLQDGESVVAFPAENAPVVIEALSELHGYLKTL